jgi:tyrosine-protein kinase Etk/Wzc
VNILKRLLKNTRLFLIVQIATVIVTIPVLLVLPKWYRSNAVILIQTETKDFNLNSAISRLLPMGIGLDLNVEIQKYIGLLKSRNISDKIIDQFELKKVYKSRTRDDVYRTLSNNVSFVDNNNGTISIYCLYKENPRIASDMANMYCEELQRLDLEISRNQARIFREMLENNYSLRFQNYEKLQKRFSQFKVSSGILEIEEQTKIALKSISEMELKKVQLEIQRDYLKSMKSGSNPEIINIENQIESYQKKIDEYKNSNHFSNVAFNKIPYQGIEYYKYFLNVEIENKILEFLTIQLEQAKLDETKILSNIVVLDRAIPPEKKFKPKRISYLITAMALTFMLTYLAVLSKEKKRKQ